MFNTLTDLANSLAIPDGFSACFHINGDGREGWRVYNDTDEIIFWKEGDGTVNFSTAQGRRTFDRRGINSSFYWLPMYKGDEPNVTEIIPEQLTKIAERRVYYADAKKVPGLPGSFTVSNQTLEAHTKLLKEGKEVTFVPGGMGVGYIVSKKFERRNFGCKRADRELENFFKVSPLYVTSIDCD